MRDKHLQNHFLYYPVRKHLKQMGFLTKDGEIIENPDYDKIHQQ